MRNLRLTEANSSSALLANTMQNGTNTDGTSKTAIVSNITLEGEITNSTSDLGGLINTVSGGEINTVTSMLKITQNATGSSEYSLGGLIGHIDEANQSGVKIYYCSNYGPITGESKGRAVGGLVGSTSAGRNGSNGNITIDHCFNGSSVLAGYTSGTGYDEQLYYAGGIIGTIHGGNNISIQITNCYNAGIIKAGNKTHTKMSYAAGIVAHSEITDTNKVQISNCYNEGSIEALGADPTTEYVVTGVTYVNGLVSNAEGSKIYLVQTNAKNVSGYHIADIAVTNCKSDGDLELDGAILENYIPKYDNNKLQAPNNTCIYSQGDYEVMKDFEINSDDFPVMANFSHLNEGEPTGSITQSVEMRSFSTNSWQFNNISILMTSYRTENSYSILQKNILNIPEIFVDTQTVCVTVDLTINQSVSEVQNIPTINRNYYYDFSKNISDMLSDKQSALGTSVSGSYSELSKSSFTSSERDSVKNHDTTIAGEEYRVVYNFDSAFESETYTGEWLHTLSSDDIGVDINKLAGKESGWYIISASAGERDLTNSLSFTVDTQSDEVAFTYSYRGEALPSDELNVKMGFSWSIPVDLGNDTSDFIYVNENAFAIDVSDAFTVTSDSGETSNSFSDLMIFADNFQTLTDAEGNEHQNVLTLTNNNVSYYFVADMANNRLIYYTNATVTGVDGVVNSKGDKTLLDVVKSIPTSFDAITLNQSVNISDVSLNGYASFEGTITSNPTTSTITNDWGTGMETSADENEITFSDITELGEFEEYPGITFYQRDMYLPYNFSHMYARTHPWGSLYINFFAINGSVCDIASQYRLDPTEAIESGDSKLYMDRDSSSGDNREWKILSTSKTLLEWFDDVLQYYIATDDNETNSKMSVTSWTDSDGNVEYGLSYKEDINVASEPPEQEGWSANYTTTIDRSGETIKYESLLEAEEAYFTKSSFTLSATATHTLNSVNTDKTIVYSKGGQLAIAQANSNITADGQDITIYQTYNGTSDRPIKAGDEVTITYDYSSNTADGTTTETYKTATFNVIYSNGAYILEYVEGTSFEGSYIESSTEGEEPSVIEETKVPLTEEEVTTLKNALNIYQNSSGELFIYADDSIDLSDVSRTSTANGSSLTWNDSAINKSGKTQKVELIGLDNNALSSAYKDKVFSFTVEGTQATVSTCFNNASTYFDIYEKWEMNIGEDVTSGNYGQLSAKSYTGIILMNDIFMPNANIALGFNIFGNSHAIISSLSGEDDLFGTIGDTENEITIKDLAFVGATTNAIATSVDTSAKLSNIDFYGAVIQALSYLT